MVDKTDNNSSDSPPIFKTWGKLYAFVFFNLVFLVILFYLFTKAFE